MALDPDRVMIQELVAPYHLQDQCVLLKRSRFTDFKVETTFLLHLYSSRAHAAQELFDLTYSDAVQVFYCYWGNKPSSRMKAREFIDQLSDYQSIYDSVFIL